MHDIQPTKMQIKRTLSDKSSSPRTSGSSTESAKVENYYFQHIKPEHGGLSLSMHATKTQRIKELKQNLEEQFGVENLVINFSISNKDEYDEFVVKADTDFALKISEYVAKNDHLTVGIDFTVITNN